MNFFKAPFLSIAAALLLLSGSVNASLVGIVDSGLDYKHKDLKDQVWSNVNETENGVDDDNNGFIDDLLGWNFANSNNQIIDYRYINLLDDDIRRFFEIQKKYYDGEITADDMSWYQEMISNEAFLKKAMMYGGFSHGTHVAGIVAKENISANLLGVKLLSSDGEKSLMRIKSARLAKGAFYNSLKKSNSNEVAGDQFIELKNDLATYATEQMTEMMSVFRYVNKLGVRVVNGSFGTDFNLVEGWLHSAFQEYYGRAASDAEVKEIGLFFLKSLIEEGEMRIREFPDTLFIFAAGNSFLDNDKFYSSPASIFADNVLSVAATFNNQGLAEFSSYGRTSVHVAAPGVNIRSTVPNDDYIVMSGTSQAAPRVTNLAAKLFDINPELTPNQVKKILMDTVDKRFYLKTRVVSGGTINDARAIAAANNTLNMPLELAIEDANKQKIPSEEFSTPIKSISNKNKSNFRPIIMPLISPIL